jgi:DNA-binding MarR family transcriptional regulator
MGASQPSKQWQVIHYIYDTHDRKPGAGFPNVSDLGRVAGLSGPAARRLIDRCVQAKLAYLFASAADPCVGLTDAGRAYARDGR